MLTIWSSENTVSALLPRIGVEDCIVGTGLTPPNPQTGTVILSMGTKVLNELIKLGIVPKGRTIGAMRNKPLKAKVWGKVVTLFVTYSPSILQRDYACYVDMLCDIKFIQRTLS